MSDVEHLNRLAFDREQDSVDMRSLAVEQVPNFNGRVAILWSQRAAGWKAGQRGDGRPKRYEPVCGRVSGLLRSEPIMNLGDVALGLNGQLNAVGHACRRSRRGT